MTDTDLVDVPLRLDRTTSAQIDRLAAQCGLTRDQMASAIAVLAFRHYLPAVEAPAEDPFAGAQ